MTHAVPYTLTLSVWVPIGPARRWRLCPAMKDAMTDELVQDCGELDSVFGAHGRLISRLLMAPGAPRYSGFRIIGRRKDTRLLVGGVEWIRSTETRELVTCVPTWTACEYVHPEGHAVVA